jgi:hypothetical protein
MACSAIDLERHIKWSATKSALDLLINFGAFEYQEPIVADEWVVKADRVRIPAEAISLFNIYPNPASDLLIVETINAGISTIELYNSLGQIVFTQNVSATAFQHALMLTDLAAGQYQLRLLNSDFQTIHTQSIYKK